MPILHWDQQQGEILDRLRRSSKLKICCKTRSEADFTRDWIEHHGAIVGRENLIIADNGSSDAATLDLYEQVGKEVVIFQFSGPHNDIHWHPRFKPLFDLLNQTVEFFSFIDVDERLVWIDHESWSADHRIVDRLQESNSIYPATWLINAIASRSRFTLLDTEHRPNLSNNLKWGKPILPAALIGVQSGMHNVQFVGNKYSHACAGRLFLLHLTQFPEHRIAANIKKLVVRKLVEHDVEPEAVLSMDLSTHADKTVLRFQKEIGDMIGYLKGDKSIEQGETEYIELLPSGSVSYSSEHARTTLAKFLDQGSTTMDETLK